MKRKFHCKIEDLPAIADFVLASISRDIADFNNYSEIFNQEYLCNLNAKRQECTEAIMTDSMNIALKSVTKRLYENLKKLRTLLVLIEGYIILAKKELNNDKLGLAKIRKNIKAGNVEGVVYYLHAFISNLNENITVLTSKGMKQEHIEALNHLLTIIDGLNMEQNELFSKRSQNCLNNMNMFNNLWDMLSDIMLVGKAIYKSTNESKLKDYTMLQIKRRMNNERKNTTVANVASAFTDTAK